MMLVKQKHKFDCMAAVAAMVLGWPIERIYILLGHDGTQRRIRTLDIVALLAGRGYLMGTYLHGEFQQLPGDNDLRAFRPMLPGQSMGPALLVVNGAETTHAVFWNGNVVLDPNPQRFGTYDLDDYTILQWWPISQMVTGDEVAP